jgi:hypothetical protein
MILACEHCAARLENQGAQRIRVVDAQRKIAARRKIRTSACGNHLQTKFSEKNTRRVKQLALQPRTKTCKDEETKMAKKVKKAAKRKPAKKVARKAVRKAAKRKTARKTAKRKPAKKARKTAKRRTKKAAAASM